MFLPVSPAQVREDGSGRLVCDAEAVGEGSVGQDVFALGATLHSLLTGLEFDPAWFLDGLPGVRERNRGVSRWTESLIRRATDPVARNRFSGARELLAELERVREHLALAAGESPWGAFKGGGARTGDQDGPRIGWRRPARREWRTRLRGAIYASPVLAAGLILLPTRGSRLHALEPAGGRIVWECALEGPAEATPAVSGRFAVTATDRGWLQAFDVVHGAPLWKREVSSRMIRSSPLFVGERIVFGSNDGHVYAYDREGSCCWRRRLGSAIYSSAATDGERLYIGADDGGIYCLEVATGRVLGRFATGGPVRATPLLAGEQVVVGSFDGKLYCLDRGLARTHWVFTAADRFFSSPVLSGRRVICGNNDGNLYCLDLRAGRELWRVANGAVTAATATVSGRLVFCGADDGRVRIVRLATGKVEEILALGSGPVRASCFRRGRLLFAGAGEMIHAYRA
jgi:outer membrane protein assembly factor BamB